jgi:RNA 3'-terminal phosphate cyclase-like protein
VSIFNPPDRIQIDSIDRSPGYALSLVAESTTATLHCAEAVSQPGVAPEDIALQAALSLLNEIERGGCVDQKHQILVLLLMVLGSEDVGRCRMAEPTERT